MRTMPRLPRSQKHREPASERSIVKRADDRILLYPAMAMLFGVVALSAGFAHAQSDNRHVQRSAHHVTGDSNKEVDPDIPISVRHSGQDNARSGPKTLKIVPSNRAHNSTARPSAGPYIASRNAIGQPVVGREIVPRSSPMPFGHSQTQPSAPPAGAMSGFANRNLATRQYTASYPSSRSGVLNQGRIGGGVPMHSPAAGLGGPSRPTGAINGTAFPPKP